MTLFLLRLAGVLLGILIPVVLTLGFCMAAGAVMPRLVAREGRIRWQFVALYVIFWLLASMVSGFLVTLLAPSFAWVTCLLLGLLLCGLLWSNIGEMKKHQSSLQVVSMTLATFGGLMLGYLLCSSLQAPIQYPVS